MRNYLLTISLLFCFVQYSFGQKKQKTDAYVFFYFEGYASEKGGLFTAYSDDLDTWHPLKDRVIAPAVGDWKVFRDPCVIKTSDGRFHMCWTAGKNGIGMAHSSNGIDWEGVEYIELNDPDRGLDFANTWAPEFYQENDTVYILWASTLKKDYVPPKDPKKWWNSKWNHKTYYTYTTDFKKYAPTNEFWNPPFKNIDATLFKGDSLYYLFYKDERKPEEGGAPGKNVVMATSKNFLGPYENDVDVTYFRTEGPIPVQTDSTFYLYYDYYWEYNGYRYIKSKDMTHWTEEILPKKAEGFKDVIRHGSIVPVSKKELKRMLKAAK